MKNRSSWEKAIVDHAHRDFPHEACGVIQEDAAGRLQAEPLRNTHNKPAGFFRLDSAEYVRLMTAGKVVAYYHSHPQGPAEHSESDRVISEETGLPCYLYDVASDTLTAYAPTGWHPPMIGRRYLPGVNDCFSLVRDWHREKTGIELRMPPRSSDMMLRGVPDMDNLIAHNNLVWVTTPPERGDLLVMHLRPSGSRPNHLAVHLGNGTFLHQLLNEPSKVEPWGGMWEQITCMILRHRSALPPPPPLPAGTNPAELEMGHKLSPPGPMTLTPAGSPPSDPHGLRTPEEVD